MKVIERYRVMKISISTINRNEVGTLDMNEEASFKTKEEAIEYAYEKGKWDNWVIITHISFDNF